MTFVAPSWLALALAAAPHLRDAAPSPVPAVAAVGAHRATPAETLLVSTEWLVARLADPSVVVFHVGMHAVQDYGREHIPGARYLDYHDVVEDGSDRHTELPPVEELVRRLESLGASDHSRVILYGPAVEVGRVFFTLDYLGLPRVAVLDGGLAKWKNEGRPVSAESPSPARGSLTPRPRPEIVAGADWIRARLGDDRVALIDTRTDGEYLGTGARRGLPSNGHLPGARLLLWQDLVTDRDQLRFRGRDELAAMYRARGADAGDIVVTYCLVGMRASLSYFVARYLGFDARMYDGSYADWSARRYPLVRGVQPEQ